MESSRQVIKEFVQEHSAKAAGTSLNLALGEKQKVVRCCHETVREEDHQDRLDALVAIKILSRDKENVNELVDRALINMLLLHAGISPEEKRRVTVGPEDDIKTEITEAQRCLNNLLLQSEEAQSICCDNDALPGLISLVRGAIGDEGEGEAGDKALPADVLTVHVKLLFLITALSPSTRTKVLLEMDGGRTLLDFLRHLLSNAETRTVEGQVPTLTDSEVALAVEVLKALFNVTLDVERLVESPSPVSEAKEATEEAVSTACSIVRDLLAVATETKESRTALHSNSINLLTNAPARLASPLLEPPSKSLVAASYLPTFHEGGCVDATKAMLDLLLEKAKESDSPKLRETTTPALSVLCGLSRRHRPVRKYLRSVILPPLRDVSKRPEEGDDPRSRLCKLLTSPVDAVATLVAEFLFVLCKESVSRMVKYTGYGNAAGLLARRGLMLGGKSAQAGKYSDEEDSDTEEYAENAHKVNPIVGCVEPQRPSPFEGMSEEQKEHEAMKLVNLINDMHNLGVVTPAVPGPDGRPQQVEHVLQLREAAEAQAGGGGAQASNNQEEGREDSD